MALLEMAFGKYLHIKLRYAGIALAWRIRIDYKSGKMTGMRFRNVYYMSREQKMDGTIRMLRSNKEH